MVDAKLLLADVRTDLARLPATLRALLDGLDTALWRERWGTEAADVIGPQRELATALQKSAEAALLETSNLTIEEAVQAVLAQQQKSRTTQ